MSEDIERHVVRKFEIAQRLGKGVIVYIILSTFFVISSEGVWHCLEGCRKADSSSSCFEKML